MLSQNGLKPCSSPLASYLPRQPASYVPTIPGHTGKHFRIENETNVTAGVLAFTSTIVTVHDSCSILTNLSVGTPDVQTRNSEERPVCPTIFLSQQKYVWTVSSVARVWALRSVYTSRLLVKLHMLTNKQPATQTIEQAGKQTNRHTTQPPISSNKNRVRKPT